MAPSRRVLLTLEVETDLSLSILRQKSRLYLNAFRTTRAWDADDVKILQVQANVIRKGK